MFELTKILIAALNDAGLAARGEMANTAVCRPGEPVCTVAIASSDVTDTAFGQYLGTLEHPEHGPLPLFGRRFRAEAKLTLFAPGSTGQSDALTQQALDALLTLQGLRIGEVRLEQLRWDDEAEAYSRTLTVQLQGMLYCLQLDEGETFTDFTLVPTII